MLIKSLLVTASLAAFTSAALAADYYIVQDTSTKRCSIVEQKPTARTSVVVGDGRVYTTRSEAEGALKTVKVCESGGTVGGPAVPAPERR